MEKKDKSKLFETVFENAPIGIYLYNSKGVFLDGNKAAEALIGYKREELIGQQIIKTNLVPKRKSLLISKIISNSVLRKPTGPNIFPLQKKDGSTIQAEVSTYPIDFSGEKLFLGIVRNVNQCQGIEDEFIKEKERAEQYLDIAGSIIVALDTKGSITLLNKEGYKTLGYKEGSLDGKDWFSNCLPKEEAKDTHQYFDKIIQGKVAPLSSYKNPIVDKDGNKKIISWRNTILKDKDGNTTGTLSSGQDITDKLESEERFRDLFDNLNSGAAIYKAVKDGKDFVFKDFNKTGEKIDKIKKEALLNKKVTTIFPGVKKFGLLEIFTRVYKTGNSEHFPLSLYKDKRIVGWRDNYVFRLPSKEVVAIYEDTTAKKQAEELLKIQRNLGVALGIAKNVNEALMGFVDKAIELEEIDAAGVYLGTGDGKMELVVQKGLDNKFAKQAKILKPNTPEGKLIFAGESVYTQFNKLPSNTLDDSNKMMGVGSIP
ncbi:PAS domain S-box protein, partial [Patescibacteria group bacterium]|nr:PAS domain S-box protein [Patescibacteria group bacterium]